MEQFGYRKLVKFQRFLGSLYPLTALVGGIAFAAIASSSDFLELKWWAPLFLVAMAVWFIHDIFRFIQAMRFAVEVGDNGIVVNGKSAAWDQIASVKTNPRAGDKRAAVTLELKDGSRLEIPGGLDGLPYVQNTIQSHVKSSDDSPTQE